jgi:hypothetical protein
MFRLTIESRENMPGQDEPGSAGFNVFRISTLNLVDLAGSTRALTHPPTHPTTQPPTYPRTCTHTGARARTHARTHALILIHLAGSENSSKAQTTGKRRTEGSFINKSLLTLATVISKIVKQDGMCA